jgi:hypothetical protein
MASLVRIMSGDIRSDRTQALGRLSAVWLMAFFTGLWSALPFLDKQGPRTITLAVTGLVASVYLVSQTLSTKRAVRLWPGDITPEQLSESRRVGRVFSITFAVEGIAIGIATTLLTNNNLRQYALVSIVLIVGLHFIPLAILFFGRSFYYAVT